MEFFQELTDKQKNMQYLGLLFEILILAFGVYVYLFSRGFFKVKDPEANKKMEDFRKENAGWMRILSLLLIALMTFEIILNIKSMFS